MERVIYLERRGGTTGRLKLHLSPLGVLVRAQTFSDSCRWVYVTRWGSLPPIPDDDVWQVTAGEIELRCDGTAFDAHVGERELGRASVDVLLRTIEELRRFGDRVDAPMDRNG